MESVEQYRQFAEECRRLGEGAPPKDKVALLEMAGAWINAPKKPPKAGKQ